MNKKSVKKAKKAIRRWVNTPWTNGTYLKTCGVAIAMEAGVLGVLGIASLVEDTRRKARRLEELEIEHAIREMETNESTIDKSEET